MVKMFGYAKRGKHSSYSRREEMDEDGPPSDYEGKEHVRYKDPGHSRHDIEEPEDEPHMKSHVSSDEEHEMEDDYHMGVPNQNKNSLPNDIKRARMKMDAPNQQSPKALLGRLTTQIPLRGVEDTSGEEMEGPNEMQEDEMPKEHRKKMIVAVMKRKMKKSDNRVPGSPPNSMSNKANPTY